MRHSLLSQFRGTLLGSIIGDAVTPQIKLSSVSQGNQQSDWYNILNYQPSEWTDKLKQVCLMMSKSSQLEQQLVQQKSWKRGECAYMVLPIILFYHENHSLLQQKITKIAQYWQWSDEILEDILIWGYIVTLVLRRDLNPRNIIKQLLVSVRAEQNPLFQLLRQLESWLFESPSLEQIVEKLSNQTQEWSIPLSIYCFSSTPEDFYLSICRAACYQDQAKITAMLTGALSGGYNGIVGIPTAWRKLSSQNILYEEIDRQGKILFNNWCGVHNKGQKLLDEDRIQQQAIAAPGAIQTRSSLRVISQQE